MAEADPTHHAGPWPDSILGRGRGPLVVDGARGEGGGQVLRTALTLAVLGGRELHIDRIRAKRGRPGLLRQHLTAVRAAARISNAQVEGDELYGSSLVFRPQSLVPGEYRFAVGTAGSATLVLQTILMPLLAAAGRSHVRLEGGTHNPAAPTFDYLERVFFPCLRKMGARIEVRFERAGFFPAGGGAFEVEIEGGHRLGRLELLERGELIGHCARALGAHLPAHVSERELKVVQRKLGWSKLEAVELESPGPGNVVTLEVSGEHITEACVAFGARGLSAERVAGRAVKAMKAYLRAPWPVGEFLADQLMLPMALAGGRMRTGALSLHAETNFGFLREFLGITGELRAIERDGHEGVELAIEPA